MPVYCGRGSDITFADHVEAAKNMFRTAHKGMMGREMRTNPDEYMYSGTQEIVISDFYVPGCSGRKFSMTNLLDVGYDGMFLLKIAKLTSTGKSFKTNFGSGAKHACLAFNQYGVIFRSRVGDTYYQVKLRGDPETGSFFMESYHDDTPGSIATEYVILAPSEDELAHYNRIKGDFFQIILLGMYGEQDTFYDSYDDGVEYKVPPLITEMANRFYKFTRADAEVKVFEGGISTETLYPLDTIIQNGVAKNDPAFFRVTTVQSESDPEVSVTYIYDELGFIKSHYGYSSSFAAIEWNNEFYSDARSNRWHGMAGTYGFPALSDKIYVFVHVKKTDNTINDITRTAILRGGEAIDLTMFREQISLNVPEWLQTLVSAATLTSNSMKQDSKTRLRKIFDDAVRTAIPSSLMSPAPTAPTRKHKNPPRNLGGQRQGGPNAPKVVVGPTVSGTTPSMQMTPPNPVWLTDISAFAQLQNRIAEYDYITCNLYLNDNAPELDAYVDQFFTVNPTLQSSTLIRDLVRNEIKYELEIYLGTYVIAAMVNMAGFRKWLPSELEKACTVDSMTNLVGMFGIQDQLTDAFAAVIRKPAYTDELFVTKRKRPRSSTKPAAGTVTLSATDGEQDNATA